MARLNLVILVLAASVTSACNPYACVYETRFVQVKAGMQSANGTVTVESMGFRQYRPEQLVSNSVSYVARGEGLSAAPTALLLRDTRDMRTVATLGMSTSNVSFAAASAFDVAAADRDAMFELLSSGKSALVVQLANDASIVVPLPVSILENWHRPSCD